MNGALISPSQARRRSDAASWPWLRLREPRALSAYKSAQLKRVYFDFGDMIKANATGYFPYTPALPMLYGLRESLKILFEEKLEHVFERHNVLASGVRAAVKAWGLHPCAKNRNGIRTR